jgi:hypothetical protein
MLNGYFEPKRGALEIPTFMLAVGHWWMRLPPLKRKVLLAATVVFLIELTLRTFAKKSKLYSNWTKVFETIGGFWTGAILAVLYFVAVSVISVGNRLFGSDPLDRSLEAEPTFWRLHEPNPLGPHASARHQF